MYFVCFATYVNFAHLGLGLNCLLSTFLFVSNFIIRSYDIVFIVLCSLCYYFKVFFSQIIYRVSSHAICSVSDSG